MKGRNTFSASEAEEIRTILREKAVADRDTQKGLRAKLRRIGFHISDFSSDFRGFTAADFDQLVRNGVVSIRDRSPAERRTANVSPRVVGSSTRPQRAQTPTRFNLASLKRLGFEGFVSFRQLLGGELSAVPSRPGVYVVVYSKSGKPAWMAVSSGGRFKGRDPSVAVRVLDAKWVEGAPIIYIGMAKSLRSRLRQFAKFGAGEAIGHWGGRYIWHIPDASDLLVAWVAVTDATAREVEVSLLQEFVRQYRSLPFANLVS